MAAAPQSNKRFNSHLLNVQTVLLASALLLPGLAPSLFGWFSGLLATPVFCLLALNGQKKGILLIRNGVLLAAIAAVILKLIPSLLFSLTMVPLAYSFNRSYASGKNAVKTGTNGVVILALTWLIFWGGYGAVHELNPYGQLLEMLETGFTQTFEYYRKSSDIPAETLFQLEQAVNELRRVIPIILPGILFCTVLVTVWINLLFSASLMARLQPERMPWKRYSEWRLPDRFVWVLIASGTFLIIGREKSGQVALALFLSAALLYFFQGLAVFIHMLEKWKVPVYFRVLIYIILILQSYGLVLLTLLGLADVWFNFRQKQTTDNPGGN